jgi:signal transduction histidine kinase
MNSFSDRINHYITFSNYTANYLQMKFIYSVAIFLISVFTVYAGEVDNTSNNSLIATYYANAKNLVQSKPVECIFWANKAIAESKIGGSNLDLGRSLFVKGQALENLHKNKAAVNVFLETLKIGEANRYFDLEIDAINKLSTLYAKEGDYKSAVLYATMLHDKKDSNTLLHQRVLAKTLPGIAYLQKREMKMKQLLADNSFLDDHLRSNLKMIDSQGNWILFIVIGYCLVFVFFIMIKRQNKLILKKNQLLTAQMHTLEIGKMELDHNLYNAEEADRLKASFLANISHEIRSPLNAIVGFSGFLRQKEKPENERRKYIEIIHRYSESLLSLINEIFTIARIESGEIKQEAETINVNEFVQKIRAQYSDESNKEIRKGIRLIMNYDALDSLCNITTYPERLKSVVLHLIDNSLKYSDSAKVEIGYMQKDAFIEFYVKDDVKASQLEKTEEIFERFRSTEFFPKPGSGDLGLGLTISKNFIESMGGKIWVKNNKIGSTFFFTLPINIDIKS